MKANTGSFLYWLIMYSLLLGASQAIINIAIDNHEPFGWGVVLLIVVMLSGLIIFAYQIFKLIKP